MAKIVIPESYAVMNGYGKPTAKTADELADWVYESLEEITNKHLFEMLTTPLKMQIQAEVNRLISMCENRMFELGLIDREHKIDNYCEVVTVDYGRNLIIKFNAFGRDLLMKIGFEFDEIS